MGLPIACSNRGPMPKVLAEGGVYFDPEDTDSIPVAVEKRARTLSEKYPWARCALETWEFVREVD